MYLDPKMQESIKKVELAREKNITLTPRRMTAEEKEELLKTYHPDYKEEQFRDLRFGPNKGEKVPLELADLLESSSRLLTSDCGCSAKNSTQKLFCISFCKGQHSHTSTSLTIATKADSKSSVPAFCRSS